jgi:nicotinamide-nucleotide adenylyltransferase
MSSQLTALFIGRFQPFHNGHLLVLRGMTKVCKKIIIGIGSSEKHGTAEDPFNAEERRDMIQRALQGVDIIPQFDVTIVNLSDHESDKEWTKHALETVGEIDIVWTGNEWTKKCFEKVGIPIKEIKEVPGISGTEVRKQIKEDGLWDELVPDEVRASIKSVDGVQRIKKL